MMLKNSLEDMREVTTKIQPMNEEVVSLLVSKNKIQAIKVTSQFDEVCQAKMLQIMCGKVRFNFVNVYKPRQLNVEKRQQNK